jgi:hypothetical protein
MTLKTKTTPAPTATGKDAVPQKCVPALSLLLIQAVFLLGASITLTGIVTRSKNKAHS